MNLVADLYTLLHLTRAQETPGLREGRTEQEISNERDVLIRRLHAVLAGESLLRAAAVAAQDASRALADLADALEA